MAGVTVGLTAAGLTVGITLRTGFFMGILKVGACLTQGTIAISSEEITSDTRLTVVFIPADGTMVHWTKFALILSVDEVGGGATGTLVGIRAVTGVTGGVTDLNI